MIDDTFALLKWLEGLSLDAHNNANRKIANCERDAYKKRKEAYDRVINYVKTMGKKGD